MELRGPHEGAPMDIPILDKTLEISEAWNDANSIVSSADPQRKNNRMFFLTVEFVENQSRDFAAMFPIYEQVSFSPRAPSPLSDFEHRVSPLDPNMSSTARYSPTPVQLPPMPFQNSAVVLQGPPSPLIDPPETNPPANINNFIAPENTSQADIPHADDVVDFVNGTNREELVSTVEGELILIQAENPELETSSAPLMLTGIPGADFTLARDFLVMHEDQLNVINTLRDDNLETIENPDAISTQLIISDKENIFSQTFANMDDIHLKIENQDFIQMDIEVDNSKENKTSRRSKRQINDKKTYWCYNCDSICLKAGECACYNVRTIADQPVPTRAIATLPSSYLSIVKLSSPGNVSDESVYGVFAKRNIRRRTQFGPIEGIVCSYDEKSLNDSLPLLYETEENGELLRIDVSNENSSNWMRFVRPAKTYVEQNLIICQQKEGIVFLTTRDILPKEELKAGPSPEYANRRNLSILEPDLKDENLFSNYENEWPCFECNENFETADQLQNHLNSHDDIATFDLKPKNKCRKQIPSTNKLFKIVDGQTLSYTCPHCPKVFPRSYNLKRHLVIHPEAKKPRYECSQCGENFLHPFNRNRHMKIFHNGGTKEKENAKENSAELKCPICNLIFDQSSLLNLHSMIHNQNNDNDGNQLSICPQCKEEFKCHQDLIKHVSKHGRAKIPKPPKNTAVMASYKCSMCYKRFASDVRLQQHYLVHGAEDQKPLACNICQKRFMNNSALSCHLKTHREDKLIFECPMCRMLFDQILMLKDHIETHRNEDQTFTCPHCPRNFLKYSIIRKHIRAHHSERKHNCQFCIKTFPTVDKLRMHLLRHSDHREFHCANCDKKFKRKDKLKEHMTRIHNSQRTKEDQNQQGINHVKKFVPKVNPTDYNRFFYKCHQCLVGFKRRGMLVNHLAKRHPDVSPDSIPELNLPILRQTRDYFCQYCDKVYKSSSKRKAHIVKNHPGAALPPSNRQKDTDIAGLSNPTFSQTVGSITTTPKNCQWCHKQYASKAKLLQHQRKKHPNLMEPADQIPRPRNRLPPDQNQPPVISDNNFIVTELMQCNIDDEFLKPKITKIENNIDLIGVGNSLEIVGQQFVRMRDIR